MYSCPFDNSQSCTVESVFQTKDGESGGRLERNQSYLLLSLFLLFSTFSHFIFSSLSLLLFFPLPFLKFSLLFINSLSLLSLSLLSLYNRADSNPLAQDLFTLLSDDSRAFNGQLLGYSLRSFENHVVVRTSKENGSLSRFFCPILKWKLGTPNKVYKLPPSNGHL